jgi:HAE1 family hydrophobic/amphiphilic exporter-1
MLVGLLGKNAILIVEFAVQRRREGMSLKEAAVAGAKLRFRPIQMTSFAFIAGLLPLVVATGPGAIGNRTIGTAAAGGMLVGTVIGVLVIPGLYYLFGRIADKEILLKFETHVPLSEVFEGPSGAEEARDGDSDRLPVPAGAAVIYRTATEILPAEVPAIVPAKVPAIVPAVDEES